MKYFYDPSTQRTYAYDDAAGMGDSLTDWINGVATWIDRAATVFIPVGKAGVDSLVGRRTVVFPDSGQDANTAVTSPMNGVMVLLALGVSGVIVWKLLMADPRRRY